MTTATVGRRGRPLSRVPRLRRVRITPARIVALVALIVVVVIAWLWFRSSSLVAVRQVQVTGVSGAEAGEIRSALTSTAEQMTTLDLSETRLTNAISGYGHIAGVTVSTHFPHGVTIHVDQRLPVASISSGEDQIAVDGTGQLLPGVSTHGLAKLPVAPAATGAEVSTASTRAVLSVLAAAPYQMLPHIKSARMTNAHGVTVTLLDGPIIFFGSTAQLALKWRAADATLASSYAAGGAYVDVSAPHRPAVGG